MPCIFCGRETTQANDRWLDGTLYRPFGCLPCLAIVFEPLGSGERGAYLTDTDRKYTRMMLAGMGAHLPARDER